MSRIQLLAIKFENLKMKEGETITEYNVRLGDIANNSFSLGKKMSEEKLVRKILSSLPKRIYMKVTPLKKPKM